MLQALPRLQVAVRTQTEHVAKVKQQVESQKQSAASVIVSCQAEFAKALEPLQAQHDAAAQR